MPRIETLAKSTYCVTMIRNIPTDRMIRVPPGIVISESEKVATIKIVLGPLWRQPDRICQLPM